MRLIRAILVTLTAAAFGLAAAPAFAQSDGSINGVVRDSSGAAVPGATVTVTNDATGASQSAVSGPDGTFSVKGLAPGDYTVEVQLRGFGTSKEKVKVTAGGVSAAEFSLSARLEEEVVVTGTRAEPRTVTESMAPIDVLSAKEFEGLSGDLSDQIRTLVPSYNVNTQPISDASTIVRPASLRNLAPDHTLVLINGERRHRAAVIYWLGNGVADGAQGPDISLIPSIAVRQVEVLRDGASAQYGSDAIAGVMNFQLRDTRKGGTVQLSGGTTQEGDGETFTIGGNKGFALGAQGFANVTAEYGGQQPDGPQRPARRRAGPDRRRQHQRPCPGPDLGLARHQRRHQGLDQLRLPVRRRPAALPHRELRVQDGRRRVLLPQPQHARRRLQPRRRSDPADRRRARRP